MSFKDPIYYVSLDEMAELGLEPAAGESLRPVEDEVERNQELAAVNGFVSELPAREKSFIHDVYWNDLPMAEVARRHNVSRMAISKSLKRIRAHGAVKLSFLN